MPGSIRWHFSRACVLSADRPRRQTPAPPESLPAARRRRRCGGRSSSIRRTGRTTSEFRHRVRRGHRRDRGLDRAGAHARGGLVLSRRRVRGARAVARAPGGTAGRGTRRQAHQELRSSRPWPSTPRCSDAYFGIGLYHYYADVAPAALRMLRWLLLLPGGDRVRGPARRCCAPAAAASCCRAKPTIQLHLIYLWYEKQPAARPAACCAACATATRRIRCFGSSSPRSRTSTCTICTPPASRRGRRCSTRRTRGASPNPR